MKKLSLTEWAALSEIVGTAAVILSLVFVVLSINRNTTVLQAANDTFLYQIQDALNADIAADQELASIILKASEKEDLSDVEVERYFAHLLRMLNQWDFAFGRNKVGLFAPEDWSVWNDYFSNDFTNRFPEDWWAEVRHGYGDDFRDHVDAAYANN